MLVVVQGPRTQLAASLLRMEELREHRVLLLARSADEAALLGREHPGAEVFPLWAPDSQPLPDEADNVAVFCCAMGQPHPTEPDFKRDSESVSRDLAFLGRLYARYASAFIHTVVVSSVIALSPRRQRAYYAGWKNVVEGAVEQLASRHARGALTLAYPGRLVPVKSLSRPDTWLSTSFAQLAQRLGKTLRTSRSSRFVLGVDGRALLAYRSIFMLIKRL